MTENLLYDTVKAYPPRLRPFKRGSNEEGSSSLKRNGEPSQLAPKIPSLRVRSMGQAIGFAVILIILGIFLPDVLHALEDLFLTLLAKATMFVDTLQVPTN